MDLPHRIVVGTDGSGTAARAVDIAAALALATDAELVVTTVWQEHPDGDGWQGERTWADQVVADAAAVARRAGVEDVATRTPAGEPGAALQTVASEEPATLVVVGSVGLDTGPERRLGSIPHHLTHTAPGDLLLVRPATTPAPDWSEVVLTTDGSDTARHATRVGLALAHALGLPATLVSVGRDGERVADLLRGVAAGLAEDELVLEPVVAEDVSEGLAAAAADRGLLVLGNRGMRGLSRLLRSVPDDLVHHLPSDLLLVNTTG